MLFTSYLVFRNERTKISNYLLWQLAYSELAFTDVLWPDFSPEHLKQIIENYKTRERRYGKV